MNILWITLEPPLPANTGGRVGIYKRLELISQENDVFLYFPYDDINDLLRLPELKRVCREVHFYPRRKNVKVFLDCLLVPYTVASRNIKEMCKDITNCISENSIDLVNIDFPHMGRVFQKVMNRSNLPVILNEHNIEWIVYKNIAVSQKNIIKKLIYYFDSFRLKSYEKRLVRQLDIDYFTFVSDLDLMDYQRWLNLSLSKLCLIPVGSDQKNVISDLKIDENMIAFIANMSYAPNIEGAFWFAKKVFPRILKHKPDSKFYIIGKNPSKAIRTLSSDKIIVSGTVDSIEPYYQKAKVVVIPLFHGGGVKVKLMEAIGYKKYVVSTSKGVEGTLYAKNGLIPIANDPQGFANECIACLSDFEDHRNLREQMYQCFLNHYTWESVGNKYSHVMKKAIHSN